MKTLSLIFAAGLSSCVVLIAFEDARARESREWPAHPRLLLDDEDIRALKQRIAEGAWAERWLAFKAAVDTQLAKPIDLPPRGGNWSHNYVCPEHGARLKEVRRVGPWEWEHRCPVGDHLLSGDPSQAHLDFDGNAIMAVHAENAQLLVNIGVVYQVTGDRHYVRPAAEILNAYAGKYLSYARHDNRGRPRGGGRVASQSLTEASWLIHMAQGADLIWNTLDEKQRRMVEERLFRPALDEVILPAKLGIHNIQCRHNAAIGLVGFLLGDESLVRIAIDEPSRGFRQQIAQGVRDDGMWCEGASGYHFFTIDGLWPLAEAARHCGLDLYDARFKSMFDAPLALSMPNLTLPNFNDSGIVSLASRADLYELAYARWDDPQYGQLMASEPRNGKLALWYGATQLPGQQQAGSRGSRNSPASGYATLERGAGEQATWLCVKYGPHGGGHGHYDKNHFILYARGSILLPDAGSHAYASSLHGSWDKTTLAHNTLVVDQKSQAQAEGRCLAFGAAEGVEFAVTDAGDIYPDVRFVRHVALLNENLVVVVDQVRADRERQLDLACHVQGKWNALPEGRPWRPPDASGYRHIANATTRDGSAGLAISTSVNETWHMYLTVAAGENTEIVTGTGIGASTADLVPIVLMRRRASETVFAWAVAIDGKPTTLEVRGVCDSDGKPLAPAAATAVTVRSGQQGWRLLANPDRLPVRVTLPQGTWFSSEPFAVRAANGARFSPPDSPKTR